MLQDIKHLQCASEVIDILILCLSMMRIPFVETCSRKWQKHVWGRFWSCWKVCPNHKSKIHFTFLWKSSKWQFLQSNLLPIRSKDRPIWCAQADDWEKGSRALSSVKSAVSTEAETLCAQWMRGFTVHNQQSWTWAEVSPAVFFGTMWPVTGTVQSACALCSEPRLQ